MKTLLENLKGNKTVQKPIWLMRQAGRYLPEYRALRQEAGSFMKLCFTPKYAAEVTLQPIRRFGFDGAILFSDILVIPYALGQDLTFVDGEGPKLSGLQKNKINFTPDMLSPIYETLRLTKKELPSTTTLLGFCGAPFTVMLYALGGTSKNGFQQSLSYLHENTSFCEQFMAEIVEASAHYLQHQIDAGAEALQIFESWSALCPAEKFDDYVITPTQKLITKVKQKYPNVPIITMPRQAHFDQYNKIADRLSVAAISVDEAISLSDIKTLQKKKTVQGNLSNALLLHGGKAMLENAAAILEATKDGPFIFNLGHGVIKETPPEHVAELVHFVQGWRA
jgi:uroporphyrinogen decarboxylase